MSNSRRVILIALFTLLFSVQNVLSQPVLKKDYSYVMEIPSIITMNSSSAHLYVLSEQEGLALFRTRPDTLQWLFTSTNMEERGNTITSDIRFGYLFGDGRRLTVLEPTSILGVYSSTRLPEIPLDAERVGSNLYVALGRSGVGRLSLDTPETVDSAVVYISLDKLQDENIIDLESSLSQLFALSEYERLFIFKKTDEGLRISKELQLDQKLNRIFVTGDRLLGSSPGGMLYNISADGELAELGSLGEQAVKVRAWRDWLIIKGESNRVWTSYQNREPELWKDNTEAGNHFAVSKNQLWFGEYNQVSRITESSDSLAVSSADTSKAPQESELKLKPIDDIIVPFPKPALADIELSGNYPIENVKFTYQSNITGATIKGSGFYWQPKSNDTGTHTFRIVATSTDGQIDSTSFRVEVNSFNAPPRFSPVRPVTIPAGEPYTLPFNAIDPDGEDENLIRYLGSNLPEGSAIDEKTGKFTWTPSARQVGENRFKVIATDQYGAASDLNVTIKVVEISRGDNRDGG